MSSPQVDTQEGTSMAKDASLHEVGYLIIGNSAAGIAAVRAIRAHDVSSSMMIVSDEPYHAYGRPLISYLLEGKTDEEHLNYVPSTFYEDLSIQTRFGAHGKVASIDPDAHTVSFACGDTVRYGKLLDASGSVAFVPPIPGLSESRNAFTFMTLDDAYAAWECAQQATKRAHEVHRHSRVLVVGGGLIGLKAAEALSYHVDDVVVFERSGRMLPAVLDEAGARILQSQLESRGIRCLPDVTIESLTIQDSYATSATLTNGEVLACDMVIAAVGVRPHVSLLEAAGANIGRGVICDEHLQTSLCDVYAAGDNTQTTDTLNGTVGPLALWPNAVAQGRIAGTNMAGAPLPASFGGSFAVNAVDFFDISLLTCGVINPLPENGYTEYIYSEGDSYAKFIVKDNRLCGFILLNRPENAGIYTAAISRKTPLDSFEDEIFSQAVQNLHFPTEARWARLHRFYPLDRDERGWKVAR